MWSNRPEGVAMSKHKDPATKLMDRRPVARLAPFNSGSAHLRDNPDTKAGKEKLMVEEALEHPDVSNNT